MVDNVKQLRIIIASPGDCILERKAVRRVCNEDLTIIHICRANHISLDVLGWEDICSAIGRPQSIINMAVEKFNPDWFVFIFWHRFGSDAGLGMTGTEEEWNLARQMNEKGKGHPKVSVFFNKKSALPHEQDDYQLEALKLFKGKIYSEYQALACSFNGVEEFEKIFQANLTEFLLNLDGGHQEITIERLQQELLLASNVVLNYQRTLKDELQIERPEFKELLKRIEESEHSTTLVLGSPGSGKSSLLSSLAHHLKGEGIPLLAIKADTLSAYVNTSEDLRKELGLSLDVRDSVVALTEREKVVVIVDQLDAVSELLDRNSGRLNVLLNLIHNLCDQKGIHIIVSSREFEYRHDVRLNSVNAEKVTLELPVWEQIVPILEQAGHETKDMSDVLKELLRTPLHLKVFLDIAKPGAVFESLHALLEELWEQNVLITNAPQDSILLLNNLAMRMAKEESLWLPLAFADSHVEACRFLEHNDILVRGQGGRTIGFRHQTFYDFTLTRAFASGSISLSDYVLERQDGLFVRPTFLSGLYYLRATSVSEYHKQLQIFLKERLRPHLFSLLIEFLGSQKDPDDVETYLMLPLLKSDTEGPKVLNAVTGSPGWFNKLCGHEGLSNWMRKPIESATHCVTLLAAAAGFSGMNVFELLKGFWFSNTTYDPLTINVLLNFKDWNINTVMIAEKLVGRSDSWAAMMLIERIAEINPELAPKVLRASLDRKLAVAIEEFESKKADIKTESQEQDLISSLSQNNALDRLLESSVDYIEIERLAEETPESFLQLIWPWFLGVINKVLWSEHDFVGEYRSDTATSGRFGRERNETVMNGLLIAVKKLAEKELHAFIQFLNDNTSSDSMIVHRILSSGLEQTAAVEPLLVLEYLLGDPRRLCLGDYNDGHSDTKQLIAAVFPHLNQSDRLRLEMAVLSFNRYKKVPTEWVVEDRRHRMQWNRQHRLRLLRAFPEEYLSRQARLARAEEERAFPGLTDNDGGVSGGHIGPRLRADEMDKASDHELINLFNELSDETKWDNPKRQSREDFSRGGGSVQQSREFGKFVKNAPHRAVNIINNLEAGRHESYVSAGLEGLAETDFSSMEIINLIFRLNEGGYSSSHFREGMASALETLAGRENGLNEEVLSLLEKWLAEHLEPEWPDTNELKEEKTRERKDAILFGTSSLFVLPHGRGTILRAITAGYLKRQPPDYDSWAQIIKSRLSYEQHPNVWAMTMRHMPLLFNLDPDDATRVYDAVIRTCPKVLEKREAFYSISHIMSECRPIEVLQEWLEIIYSCSSDVNHQAYGEMLFLYHCRFQDSWSSDHIMSILSEGADENLLLGLAYGASRNWHALKERSMAIEILCRLACHDDKSIQHAVADVFRFSRDHLHLNLDIRKVIQAVSDHPPVLLNAATYLVEWLQNFTGIEPELVSEVCQKVIQAGGSDIGNISTSLTQLAEPLTDISLTLHRHIEYREVGLRMFEDLILLNVRETRAALDILDRKPMKTLPTQYRRRRRRKIQLP